MYAFKTKHIQSDALDTKLMLKGLLALNKADPAARFQSRTRMTKIYRYINIVEII